MRLLLVWLLNAIALIGVAYILPGVVINNFITALLAAFILGLVNTILRPILVLLTLPVTVLSLGLFLFIINGILFGVVAYLLPGFQVHGFGTAILGALLYSVISWTLSLLLPKNN